MKFLTISTAVTLLSLINLSQARPAATKPSVCQETHIGKVLIKSGTVVLLYTNFYIYIVASQETCQSIATKFGQPKSDIEQWTKKSNGQFDCNNLKVGESICVKVKSHLMVTITYILN